MGRILAILSLITIITLTTVYLTDASESSMGYRSTGWSQHRAAQTSFQPWQNRRQYRQQNTQWRTRDNSNSHSDSGSYIRRRQYPKKNTQWRTRDNSNSHSNSGSYIRRRQYPKKNTQWRTRDNSNSHSNSGSYIRRRQQPPTQNPFYRQPLPVQPPPVHPPTVYVQPTDPNPFYANNPQPVIPIVMLPVPVIPPVVQPVPLAPIQHVPIIPQPHYAEAVDPDPTVVVVEPKPVQDTDPIPVNTPVNEIPITNNEPVPILIGEEPTPIIYDPITVIDEPILVHISDPIIYDDIIPIVTTPSVRDPSHLPNRGDSPYSRRGKVSDKSTNDNLGTSLDEINTRDLVGTDPNVNNQGLTDTYNDIQSTDTQLQDTTNNGPIKRDPNLDKQILADVFGTVINPDVKSTESTTTRPDIDSFINSIFSNGNPFEATVNSGNAYTGNQIFSPINFGSVNPVGSKYTDMLVTSLFSPNFQPQPLHLNNPLGKQYSNSVPFFTVSG